MSETTEVIWEVIATAVEALPPYQRTALGSALAKLRRAYESAPTEADYLAQRAALEEAREVLLKGRSIVDGFMSDSDLLDGDNSDEFAWMQRASTVLATIDRRAQLGGEVGAVCSTPECDEQAVVCAACAQGRYAEGLHDGQARVRELEAVLAAKGKEVDKVHALRREIKELTVFVADLRADRDRLEEEAEQYKAALYSISDATWAQDRDPQATARSLRSKIEELAGDVGKYARAIGEIDAVVGIVGARPPAETVAAVQALRAERDRLAEELQAVWGR